MDLSEAIRGRKSIRAFKSDPVPREKVEEILSIAIQAPSAINLQPWEFTVVMGEEKARLSRKLIKLYKEKQISCSPGNVKPLAESFSRRGVASFELMNPCLEKMGTNFDELVKSPKTVTPVKTGVQNHLNLLDSCFCRNDKKR